MKRESDWMLADYLRNKREKGIVVFVREKNVTDAFEFLYSVG